jgi:hypothetical protein
MPLPSTFRTPRHKAKAVHLPRALDSQCHPVGPSLHVTPLLLLFKVQTSTLAPSAASGIQTSACSSLLILALWRKKAPGFLGPMALGAPLAVLLKSGFF